MLKLQLNQVNASLNFFKKAVATDDTQSKYWITYVKALIQVGQKHEAVNVLTKGLE
jgi:predicted Zn-dependent protease